MTSLILDPALVSAVYSELLESRGSYTCLSKVVSARPWHRHGNLIMACAMRLKTKNRPLCACTVEGMAL
jgi:hypothetical protein